MSPTDSNTPPASRKRKQTPERQTQSNHTIAVTDIFSFPENLGNALQLIQKAVMGETQDRRFYTYLIANAPTDEEKKIIAGIRDDEIKHYAMFYQIYRDITGQSIPKQREESFNLPDNYCEGIKQALIGEQNAVMKYRQILYAMQPRVHINMMVEIITDEIRHGSLYNYLYAKNNCKD